jgi:hypothetical protein
MHTALRLLAPSWPCSVPRNVVHMLKREIEIHSQLNHPHIIALYAAFLDGDRIVLVQVRERARASRCTAAACGEAPAGRWTSERVRGLRAMQTAAAPASPCRSTPRAATYSSACAKWAAA